MAAKKPILEERRRNASNASDAGDHDHLRIDGLADATAPGNASGIRTSAKLCRSVAQFLILIGILFLSPSTSHALDPQKAITQFTHRHWGAADGIIQVTSICQTMDGYLWVATVDGLFRFNGISFSRWEPSSGEAGLPSGPDHLLVASDGSLYVSGVGYVVVIRGMHSKKYVLRNDDGRARTQCLCESKDGTVWAGTNQGLYRFTDGEWRLLGSEWGLPNERVTGTMVDQGDTLWLSLDDRLAFLRHGEKRFHVGTERWGRAEMLASAPDGRIWAASLGSSVRPVVLKGDDIELVRPAIQVGSQSLLFDHDGTLWVATVGDGLRRVRDTAALAPEDIGQFSNVIDQFTAHDGLSSDLVASTFEDREGVIWCGTEAGLDCFCETKVTPITQREGLPAQGGSLTVLASITGNVWVGCNDHGLVEIRQPQTLFLTATQTLGKRIRPNSGDRGARAGRMR